MVWVQANSRARPGQAIPVLAVCPGRGTYLSSALGYVTHHAREHVGASRFLDELDRWRAGHGMPLLRELDQARQFDAAVHLQAENAAALVFAATVVDYLRMPRNLRVVALLGNSMGWYTSLFLGGVLSRDAAFEVVHQMARLTAQVDGGQVMERLVDLRWRHDRQREKQVAACFAETVSEFPQQFYPSIQFGGYQVFGGSEQAISRYLASARADERRMPVRLPDHGPFHTSLMKPVAELARRELAGLAFARPQVPLVDGRGIIWDPRTTRVDPLQGYTFVEQVMLPFHFSRCVEVACKEFAPQQAIVLGPGLQTANGVAQQLVRMKWHGMIDRRGFLEQQRQRPFLLQLEDTRTRARSAEPMEVGHACDASWTV